MLSDFLSFQDVCLHGLARFAVAEFYLSSSSRFVFSFNVSKSEQNSSIQ